MAGLLEKSVNASIAVAMLAFFMPTVYAAEPARQSNDDPENLLHYSYSTVFGSGYFKVGDRSVGILQLPFSIEERVAG